MAFYRSPKWPSWSATEAVGAGAPRRPGAHVAKIRSYGVQRAISITGQHRTAHAGNARGRCPTKVVSDRQTHTWWTPAAAAAGDYLKVSSIFLFIDENVLVS